MKNKSFLINMALIFLIALIQGTVFYYISPAIVIPDIALMIIVFAGSKKGMTEGQLLGFFSGILEDFTTLSVPGFNAMIKTILGFLAGTLKNKMIFDPVIFPVIFVFMSTLLKGFLAGIISYIFLEPESYPGIFNSAFFIELILNSFLAPFVYFGLKFFNLISGDIWSKQK